MSSPSFLSSSSLCGGLSGRSGLFSLDDVVGTIDARVAMRTAHESGNVGDGLLGDEGAVSFELVEQCEYLLTDFRGRSVYLLLHDVIGYPSLVYIAAASITCCANVISGCWS